MGIQEQRHSDELSARLEAVQGEGVAHVLFSELYRWYGVQKLAAGTFGDLRKRFETLTNGRLGELYCVEGSNGYFLMGKRRLKRLS